MTQQRVDFVSLIFDCLSVMALRVFHTYIKHEVHTAFYSEFTFTVHFLSDYYEVMWLEF